MRTSAAARVLTHSKGQNASDHLRALGGAVPSTDLDADSGVSNMDSTALVTALQQGDPAAAAELFDRYHEYAERLLTRLLGVDSELPDAVQEVFLRAYRNIRHLRHPEALTSWMSRIATLTAMDVLRKRNRRQWLRFMAPEALPEHGVEAIDEAGQEALRRTYRLLDKLPVGERVAFSLRRMCGLELTEVAECCDCSLATVKRRLISAEATFIALAQRDPILSPRLSGAPLGRPVA